MDVIILDDRYIEKSRFSNYESFIFNERFPPPGDFTLTTYDVIGAQRALPRGTFISVDGSGEVGIVRSHAYSLGADGTQSLVISGDMALGVYAYRPAVQTIASSTFMDGEYPDGWDFGDIYSDAPEIHPAKIIKDIIEAVDYNHYGREELTDLQTPFELHQIDYPDNVSRAFYPKILPYHTIPRGSSVLDAITELLSVANMGIFTARPGSEDLFSDKANVQKMSRDGAQLPIYLYTPNFKSELAFTDYWRDYLAISEEVSDAEAPTHVFSINEDYVLSTKLNGRTGLNARVQMNEVNIAGDITDLEIAEINHNSIVVEPANGVASGQTISMEVDGRYPFRPKRYGYSPDPDDEYFFVGDAVGYRTPWDATGSGLTMRVVEFIRSMDTNGYREYPELRPFVSTSRPTYKQDGTFEFEEGVVYTKEYGEFLENVTERPTWT